MKNIKKYVPTLYIVVLFLVFCFSPIMHHTMGLLLYMFGIIISIFCGSMNFKVRTESGNIVILGLASLALIMMSVLNLVFILKTGETIHVLYGVILFSTAIRIISVIR